MNLTAKLFRWLLAAILALVVCAETSQACFGAEKNFDYTSQATTAVAGSAIRWTLQMPSAATAVGRVKAIYIATSGGACDFTVLRDGTLATTGTAMNPVRVTGKIDRSSVPAPQAVGYAGSNSTGGTQIGPVHRLASTDRRTIAFGTKMLEPGEVLSLLSSACTSTVDVAFIHEEY